LPTTVINAAGTFNLKSGCGYLQQITSQSVGTGFAVKVNDGPNQAGGVIPLLFSGGAVAIPAAGTIMLQDPLFFGTGLQIISSGTPGEFSVQWF
jgi:hypothetical protein